MKEKKSWIVLNVSETSNWQKTTNGYKILLRKQESWRSLNTLMRAIQIMNPHGKRQTRGSGILNNGRNMF